jgi:CheY-like chemotaxis protein
MESTHKLLIVDDCKATRHLIKDVLKDSGYHFIESDNGNGVIPLVIKEKPCLILLDLSMPEKDGYEVLDELIEEHYHIPVIIISSDTTSGTKSTCTSLGVEAYLEKPLNPSLLKELVNKHLQ